VTALAWVTLVAGALSGGAIAYAIGYYVGRTNADSNVILESIKSEKAVIAAADAQRQKIADDAAAQIAAIPDETPAQVIAILENQK
jgi:hypothetical protein